MTCSPMPAEAAHSRSSTFHKQPYDHDGFRNCITLTLISEIMHAEILQESICVPNLVLIAQRAFLLECGHACMHTHTDRVIDTIDHPIPYIGYHRRGIIMSSHIPTRK